MTHDKKKRQDLGIFYTREDIAEFVFDIVLLWKEKDDKEHKRWEGHKPKHYPSVVDPACGEGIFLKKAVEKGFTRPDWIFGMDIDEAVVKKWPEINLLKAFEGDEEKLKAHFFHQNGLKRIQWSQHKSQYHKKLKKEDMENEQFDLVVGNPPYGGLGLESEEFDDELIAQMANFNILPAEIRKEVVYKGQQQGVLDLFDTGRSKTISQKVKDRLKSFPIEVLFMDRFIRLAKPGGWIAIVIPDGILSNSNLHYVRQYIADRAKVEAIVSLPRDAFKHVGTSAKTSILFLKKEKPENLDYPVFLACLYKMEGDGLRQIFEQYKESIMKAGLKTSKKVYSNDFVMVRVDEIASDMFAQKPYGRLDPEYYEPKYDAVFLTMQQSGYMVKPLDDFILPGTDGITYGQVGTRHYSKKGKVQYLQVSNVTLTGIDIFSKSALIEEGSHNDPARSRLKKNDILLLNGGVGSLGRCCVLINKDREYNISQDIDRIRVNGINPVYVSVFINSFFGQKQIERFQKGVSGQIKIGFVHVKSIMITILPDPVQSHIEAEYKKMAAFHDKAMEAKAKGDEAACKKNIETAEAMLKDLIARTEAVIRGEREDVG